MLLLDVGKTGLTIQNLRRTDSIGFKILIVAAILIAFASAVKMIDEVMEGMRLWEAYLY